jgi:hypothetical protein
MNVITSRCATLCRALRRYGPSLKLRSGKLRFLLPIRDWKVEKPIDWLTDIILAYPPRIQNTPVPCEKLHKFFVANKRDQWHILREYFRCPEIKNPPYVVRPLRHEGGEGFEISQTLPDEARAKTHYWRSLWERSCEYRVFFVYGKPILVLLKCVPDGTPQNIAWNAGVSRFVTVHDHENDRLRHSKFYECAEKFFADYPFHLCAVDVLYKKHKHRVVEVNFSPGVSIPDNIVTLAKALLNRPSATTTPPNPENSNV